MLRAGAGAVVAATVGCRAAPPRAQTAGDEAQAPDAVAPGIGEITVTAKRIVEPRQSVAANVGAFYLGVRKFF